MNFKKFLSQVGESLKIQSKKIVSLKTSHQVNTGRISNNTLAGSFLSKLTYLGVILRVTKIRSRLIISFLFLTLIPLVIIGSISYSNSSKAIEDKISTYSIQVLNQLTRNIQFQLNTLDNSIQEISFDSAIQSNLGYVSEMAAFKKLSFIREIEDTLNRKFTMSNNIKKISIYSENGAMPVITFGDVNIHEDSDLIKTINENLNNIKGSSYWFTLDDSENYIFLARRIKSLAIGNNIGTILVVVDQKYISSIFEGMDLGKGSQIFMLNKNNKVISSMDSNIPYGIQFQGANLADLLNQNIEKNKTLSSEKQKNYYTTPINNNRYLVSYSPVITDKWYTIATVPFTYLSSESKKMGYHILILGIILLAISILFSVTISLSISSPLDKLVSLMREAKNGNLTVKVTDKSKDEIGDVVRNFNDMLENMKSLISKTRESAHNVLSSSEKMLTSSEQSYLATEQIAMTIQQVAKGSSDQAEEVSQSVDYMNILSDGINKVENDMRNVSNVISNTKNLSTKAIAAVKQLNDKSTKTSTASEKIVLDINGLNSDMKEIKKIVKLIVGIAEQTNLLSLNAAIEAARAGEAGKGFAVVAEEVRKLADQSKDASVMINNIINSINQKTEMTVEEANNSISIIREQLNAVEETDNAFNTIFSSMESISTHINDMEKSVKEMLNAKERSLESMETISAVSEEAAATAQEVSASTEQQMAGTEILTQLAKDLSKMADELGKSISTFKTE